MTHLHAASRRFARVAASTLVTAGAVLSACRGADTRDAPVARDAGTAQVSVAQHAPRARVGTSARAPLPLPLPTGRHGHRLHVLDGAPDPGRERGPGAEPGPHRARAGRELVVFGGFDQDSRADDRGARETWIFDFTTATWRRGADMPCAQAFGSSAVVGGEIYALGELIARYDRARDQWDIVSAAGSLPRSHFAAAAVGERIYVLGGFPTVLGGALAFDTRTRTLVDVPEPPGFAPGDHFHVLAELAGELHVVGGLAYATFEARPEHAIFDGTNWRAGPPPPRALFGKFAVQQVLGDKLLVADLMCGQRFDAARGTWSACAPMPELFVLPASYADGDRVVVVGGAMDSSRAAVHVYDLEHDVWSRAP